MFIRKVDRSTLEEGDVSVRCQDYDDTLLSDVTLPHTCPISNWLVTWFSLFLLSRLAKQHMKYIVYIQKNS